MNATLDERIAAAFRNGARSADVAELIGEAEAAAVAIGEAAEQAHSKALDPTLSASDVAAARRHLDESAFRRDRMQEAARRLGERLVELRRQEEQTRLQRAYDEAAAERDTLAAELASIYPNIAAQLADLVARIDANDYVIERINARALPNGANHLATAELVARGLRGWMDGPVHIPRLTQQLRLPTFRYSGGRDHYAWPRPQ